MTKRWILGVVVGLALLPALPAVSSAQLRTVKVACTSKVVPDNLPLFVGMRMKFFEEVGLRLEPSYFRGGGEVVRAITTHSVDLGATPSASAVLIAAARGEPLKIVSGSAAPLTGVVWVVTPDSPLKSVIRSFLRARAKAVKFIWDNSEQTIRIWAEELGLPLDAVRLAYKDLPRGYYEAGAPKEENLKGALQEVMESGAVKQPPDLKKLVDLSFLPR